MIRLERCTIEMPLRIEIVERLPVPLFADHVGLVAHKLLEAVELRGLYGVGVAEPNTKEIDQLVEARVLCSRHLAQSVTGIVGQLNRVARPSRRASKARGMRKFDLPANPRIRDP
jgi:hypothetical protein